jgi:hypothetical protein
MKNLYQTNITTLSAINGGNYGINLYNLKYYFFKKEILCKL